MVALARETAGGVTVRAKFPRKLDFLLGKKARFKVVYGGRGGAKSWAIARALLIRGVNEPGLRVLCTRQVQSSMKESVHQLLKDQIELLGLGAKYRVLDDQIRGPGGTLFTFKGLSDPDALKSTEGVDVCWIEEAHGVLEASWDKLEPTIRKPGSEIWAEWNPHLETDPVDVMFRGPHGPPPGSLVRRVNWDSNPFFPDVLKAELEFDRKRDPEKYAHVWLGEYSRNSEARVFRNWTVEDFETPPDVVHRFGADWGFSVDPTVLVRCHIVGRKLFVDYEAYQVGCEIDHTPALFDTVEGARKWTIRADSARPETVSYMQRKGFKIVPAIKGPGSIEDGVAFLQSYRIVVHPRCKLTAAEMATYSYEVDKKTGEVLPLLEDKNNNAIDALRYALEGLRRAPRQTVVTPPRNPPDLWGRPKGEVSNWKTA